MPVTSRTYSIREASELSGLAASTLRYYEQIGIIQPIGREAGGRRFYSQEDMDLIDGVACLSATGMSIPAMRQYLAHRLEGAAGAAQERELLARQQEVLAEEAKRVRLRQEYVALKIAYWQAVEDGDEARAAGIADEARLAGTVMRQLGEEGGD